MSMLYVNSNPVGAIGSAGSGGHVIENPAGTDMTQRANLQFVDAGVSDDSVNDRTKVEVVTELQSESDFDNLATDGTADGAYCFPDSGEEYLTAENIAYDANLSVKEAIDNDIEIASVTADGVKTNADLLYELMQATDESKVTVKSVLTIGPTVYNLSYKDSGSLLFGYVRDNFGPRTILRAVALYSAGNCTMTQSTFDSAVVTADLSASVPYSGMQFIIYK